LTLFLHTQGYNFFNIPRLTYAEVGALVDAWNRQQKEQQKAYKKRK